MKFPPSSSGNTASPDPVRPGPLTWLAVGAGLIVLALLTTWPLARLCTTHYLGGEQLPLWLWKNWWIKEILVSFHYGHPTAWGRLLWLLLNLSHYPEAGNVTDLILISWPLEYFLGNPLAFNLKIWLVLLSNGLAAFALCHDRIRDRWMSFLGAIIITFNPYVFMLIDDARIREGILVFLLLGLLFLARCTKTRHWPDLVMAGIMAGMAAAFYWFYGLFMVMIALTLALIMLIRPGPGLRRGTVAIALVIWLSVFSLTSLPFAASYLRLALDRQSLGREVTWLISFPGQWKWTADGRNVERVLEPTGYPPQGLSELFEHSRALDYLANSDHRHSVPFLFLLALPGIWWARRRLPGWPYWLLLWGGFFLLSLGPYLKLGANEIIYTENQGAGVRMLYVLAYRFIPFYSRMTQPDRSEAMVFIALGILNAVFWSWAAARMASIGRGRFPASMVLSLVLMSAWLFYYGYNQRFTPELRPMPVPEFYRELARGPDLGLVEVPFGGEMDVVHYYQTVHHQRILRSWCDPSIPPWVGGRAAWLAEPEHWEKHSTIIGSGDARWKDNPLVEWLEGTIHNDNAIRPPALAKMRSGMKSLRAAGYRYLVVHQALLDRGRHQSQGRFLPLCAGLDQLLPRHLTLREADLLAPPGDMTTYGMVVYKLVPK